MWIAGWILKSFCGPELLCYNYLLLSIWMFAFSKFLGIKLNELKMMVFFFFEWNWEPLLCNSVVIVYHNRRNYVTKWMLKRICMKRHIIVIYWCYLCKKSGETVNHLLLHCEWASVLWNSIFGLFCLAWAMPCQVRVLFAYWRGKFGNPPVEWSSLEDDSTMLNVVHLERKKWLKLWR